MLRNALAIAAHLSPLVPLCLGHPPACAALVLVVLAFYVKDRKLGAMERYLLERSATPLPAAAAAELASLRSARRRWQYLQLPWLRVAETPATLT